MNFIQLRSWHDKQMGKRHKTLLDSALNADLQRPRKRIAFLLFVLILLVCLTLTGILWREAHRQANATRSAAAVKEADAIGLLVSGQLAAYELILHGNAALRASIVQIQREQWSTYVRALDIGQRYPGAVGVGLALYFDQSHLIRMQDQVRRESGQLFTVWPSGVRAEYGPIVFLAPEDQNNSRAYGYDMYSEPVRHEAMQRAMESGKTWLTAPLQLKQDGAAPVTSAILYLPIYRNNAQPQTLSARRAEMLGWSYIPFHTETMIRHALKPLSRNFLLAVEAIGAETPRVLFKDAGKPAVTTPVWSSEDNIFGQTWRTSLYAKSGEVDVFSKDLLVLLIGIPLSFSLASMVLMLALTRSRAYGIAQEMNAAHRRSETLLRSALTHSAIGKSLLDSRGRILQVNPAFCQIMMGEESDFIERVLDSLFDRGAVRLKSDHEEPGVWSEVRRLVRKNGEIRHISLTFATIPREENVEVAQIVQVQDITDRITNEARIQSLNRTLESRVESRTRALTEANEELKGFAYTVSHDLRAPLRAIEGFSQILSNKHAAQLDDTGKGYLQRIRTAAMRMSDLIDGLLKVSRLSQSELQRRDINISDIANEVRVGLEESDPSRRVRFDIEPDMHANGDPALISNLLQNLIGNAWKFTREKPDAVIRFGRTLELPHGFFVEDNGAGFSESYAHNLFRPFQRLHTDTEFEGHGIGLTSVKRVVERHGGEIRARGEVGKGARFVFNLPPGDVI